MKKILPAIAALLFAGSAFLLATGTSSATDFGTGPGCSPIEGVDALNTLADGDFFVGEIGKTGVTGLNPAGRPADTTNDGDAFTDSLEACINDALLGFCTTLNGDDDDVITVELVGGATKPNKQRFKVTFDDTSGCDITQCSNRVDDDSNGDVDLNDPDCADYDDNDESS